VVEGVARLFVAAPLDDDSRHVLSRLLVEAAPRGLPGRVVPPENWHVTLRFLGDVRAPDRDRLLEALERADLGEAFAVRWGGLGAFPRPRRATVLWVRAERGAEALRAVAGGVEEAAVEAGFPPEDRPFRAHLTLSRIRPHQDVTALTEGVGPLGVTTRVDRVVLYRSHLGPGGARYHEVESFPLV
jgi:2'-5' RNA ligase